MEELASLVNKRVTSIAWHPTIARVPTKLPRWSFRRSLMLPTLDDHELGLVPSLNQPQAMPMIPAVTAEFGTLRHDHSFSVGVC